MTAKGTHVKKADKSTPTEAGAVKESFLKGKEGW